MALQAVYQVLSHLSKPLTRQLLPLERAVNRLGKLPRLLFEVRMLLFNSVESPGDGGIADLQLAINKILYGMMDMGRIIEEVFQDVPDEVGFSDPAWSSELICRCKASRILVMLR